MSEFRDIVAGQLESIKRRDSEASAIARANQAETRRGSEEGRLNVIKLRAAALDAVALLVENDVAPSTIWKSRESGSHQEIYDSPRGGGIQTIHHYEYNRIGQGWHIFTSEICYELHNNDIGEVGIDASTKLPIWLSRGDCNSGQTRTGGPVEVKGIFNPEPMPTLIDIGYIALLARGTASLIAGNGPYKTARWA